MKELILITENHEKTHRDYLARMIEDKVHCMNVASKFDEAYWDGARKYGYGGYHYDGRWAVIALELIELYQLCYIRISTFKFRFGYFFVYPQLRFIIESG